MPHMMRQDSASYLTEGLTQRQAESNLTGQRLLYDGDSTASMLTEHRWYKREDPEQNWAEHPHPFASQLSSGETSGPRQQIWYSDGIQGKVLSQVSDTGYMVGVHHTNGKHAHR